MNLTRPQKRELVHRFLSPGLIPITLKRGRTVVMRNLVKKGLFDGEWVITQKGADEARWIIRQLVKTL